MGVVTHNGCAATATGRCGGLAAILAAIPPSACGRPGAPGRDPGRFVQESCHQADVPTQEGVSAQDPRFPCAHGDARGAQRPQGPPPEGTPAADPDRATLSHEGTLRGRGRFAAVRSEGRLAKVGIVRVHAAVNPVGTARVGLAVPRVRSAVTRNRIRRRLRAAGAALNAHAGFDLVVSAGGEALTLPFSDLRTQVTEAARMAVARAQGEPSTELTTSPPARTQRSAPTRSAP